jgi:hypothetical protein
VIDYNRTTMAGGGNAAGLSSIAAVKRVAVDDAARKV